MLDRLVLGLAAGANESILVLIGGSQPDLDVRDYGRFKSRLEIPFGPYLILGLYVVLLFHAQVLDSACSRAFVRYTKL